MTPIAVTGMHRTGSSMVAKTLRLAGLYLGPDRDLVEPARDNPGGFFEHAGFVRLDDDLLQATGGSWDHPPPCGPMAADDPRVAALRVPARDLVTTLAVAEPWGWKDPRTCLTARFWLDLVPELRIVVCVRHPLEVALSLKRRNQASYTLGLSLWHAYFETLLDAVPEDRRLVTHYSAYFRDARAEVTRILEFADLPTDAAAEARTALDPGLRHHRLDISLSAAGAPPETIDLYRRLCAEAGEAPERNGASARGMVIDRTSLDLVLAREHVAERDRHIGSLERDRGELADRVATLEATADQVPGLADVAERLDGLEDALHDLRYQLEGLAARSDAPIVRACRALVRTHVPRGDRVLVVAKGDPALLDLHGHPASNFPQDERGEYPGFPLGHSASAIAHLEAQRLRRSRFLLVPETARWWIEHFSAFAEHLASRYRVVRDDPDAGLLVDIATRRGPVDGWPRAASDVIDRISTSCDREPAILDWTDLDMRSRLAGRNVFVPPPEGERLAYLDATVDVVLVDDPARIEEARRVAAVAVVSLEHDRDGLPSIAAVETFIPGHEVGVDAPTVVIVGADQPDATWLTHLHEAIDEEPSTEVIVGGDRSEVVAAAADAEMVAFVEEGVLPLPGCFAAARVALGATDRVGGVAVKLLAADGSLEAAGVTVFADGSWAGVARGSYEIAAPWHDYVRETCWGPGLTFLSGAVIDKIGRHDDVPPAALHSVWSAELWDVGFRVLYQPDAAAVRAAPAVPEGGDRTGDAVARAWDRALASRPAPPQPLDEPAWRALVARDDVEAGWR